MAKRRGKAEITFEEAFKELEEIVRDLESGELSLDESLKRFEEGISLLQTCRRKLEEAEHRVEILMSREDGSLYKRPFDVDLTKEEEGSGD